ncbi:unnamed protein product, partial [Prunus brigantina]
MISQVSTDLSLAEDDPVIGFQKKDLIDLDMPHNDALVISIQIARAMVDRIHADKGSAANILQLIVIQHMGLEAKINKSAKSLTGFNGAITLVHLDPDKPERTARIGSRLNQEEKAELVAFLQNNKDVFAWSPYDMPGIDPQIICHRLYLLAAGFIEEVSYAEWLANVVLVAKKDKGLWRVCVDYTDLNKACPKDNFPLPRIDQLVDSTSGNQLLSFIDTYSGYNQIMMHEDDRVKTSFIIERGTYCYKVMPFGLK